MKKYKVTVVGPSSEGELVLDMTLLEAQFMSQFIEDFNSAPYNAHTAAPYMTLVLVEEGPEER